MRSGTTPLTATSALALTLSGALAASASDLLWQSPELMLDTRNQNVGSVVSDTTEGRIVVRCSSQAAGYCGAGAPTRNEAEALANEIGETILEIRAWFDDVGLLPSALNLRGRNERRVHLLEGQVGDGSTRAHITGGARVSSMVFQVGSALMGDDYAHADLAHEWYHTASAAEPERRWRAHAEVDNLEEAIAEAVGLAFAFPGRNNIDAHEPLDLHRPFLDPEKSGYEKAPYILFLGSKLGAQEDIGHVRAIMDQLSDDGMGGLSYLHDPAFEPFTFDRLYPEFVARMNQPHGDLYYGQVEPQTWNAGSIQDLQKFSTELVIPPHATDPVFIETIEARDLPPEPRDRLVVARAAIKAPSLLVGSEINMIHEHEVTSGASHTWLMALDDTNEGPFLRATNAAPNPESTVARHADLEATMGRVAFDLPECVAPGTTHPVSVSGTPLGGADNFRLQASAGTFNGRDFTAPDEPGEVEVRLEISSPITRGPGISPSYRSDTSVDLGTIRVADEACMIRMNVPALSYEMTYTFGGDYTEYRAGGAQATYVGVGRMAFNDPGGRGWADFPPNMSHEMPHMSPGPLDMLGPDEMDPDAVSARMPRYMTKAMSWDRMQGMRNQASDSPVDSDDCPSGGQGCVGIQVVVGHHPEAGEILVPITYDAQKRPIRVRFPDGSVITFEYGNFDIVYPPVW